jgi:hypothetical protein
MKHARKMILVDYEKYMQNEPKVDINVKPKNLFNLDKQMNEILNLNGISDREKHQMYLQKLNKFLHFVNKEKTQKNIASTPEFIKKETVNDKVESDSDSFSENLSLNDENFFEVDSTFEQKTPKNKTSTPKNLIIKQNDNTAEGSISTPSKTNKRKYNKKGTPALLRSPVTLRSKSNNKNQIGGWISFNKINLLCRNKTMCCVK